MAMQGRQTCYQAARVGCRQLSQGQPGVAVAVAVARNSGQHGRMQVQSHVSRRALQRSAATACCLSQLNSMCPSEAVTFIVAAVSARSVMTAGMQQLQLQLQHDSSILPAHVCNPVMLQLKLQHDSNTLAAHVSNLVTFQLQLQHDSNT